MDGIQLLDDAEWAATPSAVRMVLRFAAQAAETDDVAKVFKMYLAMDGADLNVSQLDSEDIQAGVLSALDKGAKAMRLHLEGLVTMVGQLEDQLATH